MDDILSKSLRRRQKIYILINKGSGTDDINTVKSHRDCTKSTVLLSVPYCFTSCKWKHITPAPKYGRLVGTRGLRLHSFAAGRNWPTNTVRIQKDITLPRKTCNFQDGAASRDVSSVLFPAIVHSYRFGRYYSVVVQTINTYKIHITWTHNALRTIVRRRGKRHRTSASVRPVVTPCLCTELYVTLSSNILNIQRRSPARRL